MPFVEYDEVEAICPDCGMSFRSEEALEHHRGEVHQSVPLGPAPRPARRKPRSIPPTDPAYPAG